MKVIFHQKIKNCNMKQYMMMNINGQKNFRRNDFLFLIKKNYLLNN